MRILNNMNWELLRQQKSEIADLIEDAGHMPTRVELLTGLIHLLDNLQDYAVDDCGFSEEEVFGTAGLEDKSA